MANYAADPNGFGNVVQETKAGVTKSYTYRADGLLSGFQSGSTQVASYYDALGRLAARSINDGTNSYTQSYAYIGRGQTLLQAKAGDGTITTFLSGQGENVYLAESKSGVYKGFVTDQAGSILNNALAGSAHRYSLHGEPTGSATLSPTSDPAMLGWQGLRYNPESGNWDNLRRDYNPGLGTFTSHDPIGIAGGLNLYGSRRNNPLRFSDPFGLDVTNNSGNTVYVKDEKDGSVHPVPPGSTWVGEQDGLITVDGPNPGQPFKTVDGIDATVNGDGSISTSVGSVTGVPGMVLQHGPTTGNPKIDDRFGGYKDDEFVKRHPDWAKLRDQVRCPR